MGEKMWMKKGKEEGVMWNRRREEGKRKKGENQEG